MANGFTTPRRAWTAVIAAALVVSACTGSTASSAPAASTAASAAATHSRQRRSDDGCQHRGERRRERLAAASGSAAASPAASGSAAAAQPYAGQEITLETYASVPEFDFYATLMPQFTAQTGIKVNYLQQPVAAQDQKIPLQLTAKDTSLDVFFTGSENIGHYVGISGVEPLDSYINDTSQTPADWNFKDIAPAVESACQQDGKTYCIASHTGGGLLYYNKKMFEDAGITAPPNNPDELLADADEADHRRPCRLLRPRRQVADAVRRLPAVELVHPVRQPRHRHLLRPEVELPHRHRAAGQRSSATSIASCSTTTAPEGHRDLPGHQLPGRLPAGSRRDVAGRLGLDPGRPRPQQVEGRRRTPRSGRSPASPSTPTTARSSSRSAPGSTPRRPTRKRPGSSSST